MDRLVSLVQKNLKNRYKSNDDAIDRLSSKYTVIILIVFAVLVSLNQYVRNPITCWAPKQFHGSHTKFTNNYCWATGTYYLSWKEDVLKEERMEQQHSASYYRWVPFILLGQAMLFYLPAFIWHAFNSKSGVDADSILETANRLDKTDSLEKRNKIMRMLTKQIDRFLSTRKSSKYAREIKPLNFCLSRRGGAYLMALFLVSKVLYVLNIVFQLISLSYVLGFEYSFFGFDMISKYLHPNDWTEEDIVAFPRVTLCDFRIRGQDFHNVQNNTVQCVLPGNMVNEKIFTFLWFWMVIVAIIGSLNFFVWLARATMHSDRVKFIQNRLGLNLFTHNDSSLVHSFVDDYLGQDGSLLLRLIAHNINHVTSTEIICDVWSYWKTNYSGTPSTLPVHRNLFATLEMSDMIPLKS